MRKISKLLFVITALTFALSFGVVSNSPTAYATSGGGEGRCSDFSEASDREMCNDQYNECQAATGGNNCMERAVQYTQENGTQAEGGEPDVCTAGALGWIVCPAIDFLATMNDAAYAAVEALLYVNPVALENGGPLFETWQRFRDIANALFVVAILVIVFSQATSLGLSSYGVKKLLPRVIAAAILVNISFFLCQIAIDISNIVGVSIHSLFESFYSDNDVDIDAISFSSLITGILAGGALWGVGAVALGSGGIMAAMASLLPFLVTALFAVITALVVLIARQVIIILLVALSPLAFVALILPNTQKYFQMWQNTITTMLVMFPLVAALFAGSKLAANIVLTSPTSDEGGGISLFSAIAAICMMFIPLFAVPFIVKFSGGTLGRLAGMVNNPNKGPFDKLRKTAEGYRDFKKDQSRKLNNEGGGGWAQRNMFGRYQRRNARIEAQRSSVKREADREGTAYIAGLAESDEKFQGKLAGGRAYQSSPQQFEASMARAKAQGVASLDKLQGEELGAAKTLIDNMQFSNSELSELATYGKAKNMKGEELKGGFYQKAAQQQLISTGQVGHIYKMLDNASNMSPDVRGSLAYHLGQNYSVLKAKDHTLNDDSIKQALVSAGGNVNETILQSAALANMPGLTKEVFAGQDAKGIANLKAGVEVAKQRINDKNTAPEVAKALQKNVDKAYEVARSAYEDTTLTKKFSVGSKMATEEFLGIKSTGGPGGSGTPPAGPAPSGGSPAAPRGPSGPPPAAPLGYAPAPQATVAPTPPPAQVVQAPAPIQQTPTPATSASNLPPAQPAQQANITVDAPRYTTQYSQNDIKAMGPNEIRTIIREVPQGAQGLSNADVAKIINATRETNETDIQDINQELRIERNRRRGGFDPTSGPKNPLP